MKKVLAASLAALLAGAPAIAQVKIGMITTLSGGGSHLGIDVRDGFELALTGSPAFQIALDIVGCTMEEFSRAVRSIDITRDGVQSKVVYL